MTEGRVELVELRRELRALLAREAPDTAVAEWDAEARFPEELYRVLAQFGATGVTLAEEYGGAGVDYAALAVVVEELARRSGALAWAYLTTVSVGATAIARFGSDELRERVLPHIADGTLRIAVALSEPGAGSDLGALRTTATLDGDTLVVSGQKVFTTGADSAGFLLTLVRTSGRSGLGGTTFVLIPPDAEGVQIRALRKMAGQAVHTCEVFLDGVRVPRSDVVGDIGGAAEILFESLDRERTATAAMGLGIAQGALDVATAYASERRQFGRPIAEHQAVAHHLADMAIAVDGARLLTERAVALLQAGSRCRRESAIAKIAASESGTFCANRGMQVLGGYSYMLEYGMERYWREAKLYEIAAGTNEILRDAVAKELRAP